MTVIFKVLVNGEPFVVAGEASMSVLSAHVTAVGRLGPESEGTKYRATGEPDIDLSVGGLTSRRNRQRDEHLRWGDRLSLKLGDQVTITVSEGEDLQSPTSRHPAGKTTGSGVSARRRWIEARSLYFRNKARFETRSERKPPRLPRHVVKSSD